MSHKTNPISNRLPLNKSWRSKWFNQNLRPFYVIEDAEIRRLIADKYQKEGGIEKVEIERSTKEVKVIIHTSRPGIVIGRSGQGIQELRALLERKLQSFREKNFDVYIRSKTDFKKALPKVLKIEIVEIKVAELHAQLVAQNIAFQIERRVPYRRVVKQALEKTMQKGAKGIKISVAGRLGGSEIARREKFSQGTIPLQTFRNDVDFVHVDAKTSSFGTIGVKVWIYRGDRLADALSEGKKRDF